MKWKFSYFRQNCYFHQSILQNNRPTDIYVLYGAVYLHVICPGRNFQCFNGQKIKVSGSLLVQGQWKAVCFDHCQIIFIYNLNCYVLFDRNQIKFACLLLCCLYVDANHLTFSGYLTFKRHSILVFKHPKLNNIKICKLHCNHYLHTCI